MYYTTVFCGKFEFFTCPILQTGEKEVGGDALLAV